MKKTMILMFTIALLAINVAAQTATTTTNTQTPAKQTTKKEPKQAKKIPTSDADIEQCITTKIAKAPKLGKDNLTVTVSGGAATLTGNVPDPGSKGGAGSIGKSCGAKSVVNNITFTAKPKTPKPAKTTQMTSPPSAKSLTPKTN